jgi:hypothetical protein
MPGFVHNAGFTEKGEIAMSFLKNAKTRREFVRDVTLGGTAAAIAGSMRTWPATMATNQYAHCFKGLLYKKPEGKGPGNADSMFHLTGKDMDGVDSNFSFGYYSKTGSWEPEGNGGRYHPYDSVLLFGGLNPKVPDYLGAEIEISIGPENEKHVFDSPTVVCIPRYLPYGPIITRKVEKPFGHYNVGLAGEYNATQLPASRLSQASTKGEFKHLVKKLNLPHEGKPRQSKTGPGNADNIAWPRGAQLENFLVNCSWGFYSQLGNWHTKEMDPHIHFGDEYLVFVGLDASRPQYLGAAIDFYIGEDERTGKKLEMYLFDVPTCRVRRGWFMLRSSRKVDQTYIFPHSSRSWTSDQIRQRQDIQYNRRLSSEIYGRADGLH